jgi:hypothetical protein
VKNIESSGLFSMGKPKVKTILSMGKESEIKLSDIPKAHKRYVCCDLAKLTDVFTSNLNQTPC